MIGCDFDGLEASINRVILVDLFDGEHGEPVISHKRTLIEPITLRNTLQAIKVRRPLAAVVSAGP